MRFFALFVLCACAAPTTPVVVEPALPIAPGRVSELVEAETPPPAPLRQRRAFVDDNLPFDLYEGSNINLIPSEWIPIFCSFQWESRAEPFTNITQWNPCLRADKFVDAPIAVAGIPAPTPVAEIPTEAAPQVIEDRPIVPPLPAEQPRSPVYQQTFQPLNIQGLGRNPDEQYWVN